MNVTRRDFLKSTGIMAAGLSFSQIAGASPFKFRGAATTDWRINQTPTICAMCNSRCLMHATSTTKKLIKLTGNPNDPFTKGHLCAKGIAAIKTLYDPDRLKYPLKRVGPRGKGEWRRISWGEAIDTIADKIEKSIKRNGPESIALFANGPSSRYIIDLFQELKVERINNASDEFCRLNRESALLTTFGKAAAGKAFFDFERADCVVLFGSHFGENMQVPEVRQISLALERGAKLIVVDPRMSVMASKADFHLMIRPGTDTALLLGWINALIENKFYNSRFVEEFTEGVGALSKKVAEFSLERVAALTDLEISDLRRCLDLIASSAPNVLLYPGNFSAWYGNDYQRLRALAIMRVLTAQPDSFADFSPSQMAMSEGGPASVLRRHSHGAHGPTSAEILRETSKGEVKVLGSWGQNPFHASPNPYQTMAAYEKADFTFCCDIFPTETALYADIILPEATFLERMDGVETWQDARRQVVALRYPVVQPMFEAKEPYWIVKQLSSRLGKGRLFRFNTVEERINSDLREVHLSVSSIKESGGLFVVENSEASGVADLQFPTSSTKIELFSQKNEDRGMPPLPDFQFSSLPPKGFARLLNGRSPVHSGVSTNNPWLLHEVEENELWLNDRVAAIVKIQNGDRLFLENQDGIRSVAPVKIKVTPGIRVDCLFLAHGFGSNSPFLQLAFNRGIGDGSLMTRSSPDPTTGVRGIRGNFVRFIREGKAFDLPQLDTPPEELRQNSRWWLDSFGCFEKGSVRGEYV